VKFPRIDPKKNCNFLQLIWNTEAAIKMVSISITTIPPMIIAKCPLFNSK
jgi:hypothetical protein